MGVESQREQHLRELIAENGQPWLDGYKPGSFGCHELLDRTSLFADALEESILNHPACVQDPDWFAQAEQAVVALRELYQQIGAKHLG
jgi:hypothetical protein